MIAEEAAGPFAAKVVRNYVEACECETKQDFANALIAMLGVCAGGIAQVKGTDECCAKLLELIDDIKKSRPIGETMQ